MGFGDASKKEKQADKAAAATEASRQAAEDAEWGQGGKKANKKQEAAADRAAAKADRKAAAEDQAAEEDAQMSARKSDKDKKKEKSGKLTRAEIAAKAMKMAQEKEKAAKKEAIEVAKSGGNEYIGVLRENDNKTEGIDASGVDDAIAALDIAASSSSGSGNDGKKVNVKALYKSFEEAQIERLKIDHPGLKLSQMKEKAFEAWKKSPENPANWPQAPVDVS